MLALTVRSGEYITIGPDIVVQVIKAGEITRLAIQAPRELNIARSKNLEQAGETPECIQRLRQLGQGPRPHKFKQPTPKDGAV